MLIADMLPLATNAAMMANLTNHMSHPQISNSQWEDALNRDCNLILAMNSGDELAVKLFPNKTGTVQSEFINWPRETIRYSFACHVIAYYYAVEDFYNSGYRADGSARHDFHSFAGPAMDNAMRDLRMN